MDELQGSRYWLRRHVELQKQLTGLPERHLPVEPVNPHEPLEPTGEPLTPQLMEPIEGLGGAVDEARRRWMEELRGR